MTLSRQIQDRRAFTSACPLTESLCFWHCLNLYYLYVQKPGMQANVNDSEYEFAAGSPMKKSDDADPDWLAATQDPAAKKVPINLMLSGTAPYTLTKCICEVIAIVTYCRLGRRRLMQPHSRGAICMPSRRPRLCRLLLAALPTSVHLESGYGHQSFYPSMSF